MASPVAHTLTGAIIYFAATRRHALADRDLWWLILGANLADLDLIPGILVGNHSLFHRTFSHSILAALCFALIVYAICRGQGRHNPERATLLMFTAYVSQLFVDWLGFDPGPVSGIPLFWPFSQEHYMAAPTIFLNIERDQWLSAPVIIHNLKAVLLEVAILGPPALFLWWQNRRRNRKR